MSLVKYTRWQFSALFDFKYLIRFSLIFLCLFYFNYYYIGALTPEHFYLPFCDHYLNYFSWIRQSILFSSNLIAHGFGLHSYIADETHLRVWHGTSLFVGLPCLGIGVMIFWTAFVLADESAWKKKIAWWLGGILAVWCINSFRVAFILLAFQNNWKTITHMDHHTAFNILSYLFIFLMMFLYFKKNSRSLTRL
jgi:exosortase/archaeosortase family protein